MRAVWTKSEQPAFMIHQCIRLISYLPSSSNRLFCYTTYLMLTNTLVPLSTLRKALPHTTPNSRSVGYSAKLCYKASFRLGGSHQTDRQKDRQKEDPFHSSLFYSTVKTPVHGLRKETARQGNRQKPCGPRRKDHISGGHPPYRRVPEP